MKKTLITIEVALWLESPEDLDQTDVAAVVSEMNYKFISNSPIACVHDVELREIKILGCDKAHLPTNNT